MLPLCRRRGVILYFYWSSLAFPAVRTTSLSLSLCQHCQHSSVAATPKIRSLTSLAFQPKRSCLRSIYALQCPRVFSTFLPTLSTTTSSIHLRVSTNRYLSSTPLDEIEVVNFPLTAISTADMNLHFLAKSWVSQILQVDEKSKITSSSDHRQASEAAIARTIPFFLPSGKKGDKDSIAASSVPFVCRYRTDIIHPLSTQQVHALQSLVTKHRALQSLREKLLTHFPSTSIKDDDNDDDVRARIIASTSKAELEDLYAPFKPPPRGSILERIQSQHPQLVQAVEELWQNKASYGDKWIRAGPREALIHLLGTKIAAEPKIIWMVMEELRRHCRIQTTASVEENKRPSKKSDDMKATKRNSMTHTGSHNKYSDTYGNFSGHLVHLKDYQVLAIRRGVNDKALKMVYDIDSEKMEKFLLYQLRLQSIVPLPLKNHMDLLKDAVHDAWSRLLRRRGTTRLWSEKCKEAQHRACQVFEDNLRRALLAPPFPIPSQPILALDPGFVAGIKCAILDANGNVQSLDTVKFVGNEDQKQEGIQKLEKMLLKTQKISQQQSDVVETIIVALGNGHGSQECREIIQTASANIGIPVDIQLVNEAGASVWSVTKEAEMEFPKEQPASIAAISIGRRLQNPLLELVKVPPKSLGLGMYQHDLSERELDERLQLTTVDAVATVGVMVNSCSVAILQKVPGLSASLANKIIQARPLLRRTDLLQINGIGPKTFENCAGFVRISTGPEPLDDTLIHPESYELTRWLLKKFSWTLDQGRPANLPSRGEWSTAWKERIDEAAHKFHVSSERVLAVLDNLIDSMSKEDPRLRGESDDAADTQSSLLGLVESCKQLPRDLCEAKHLETETAKGPIRGIVGTVRNVADFGAFIDIGSENHGLLHVSKLGPSLPLSQLLIGQLVGVDVLSASNGRVSLGLHGCNLDPSPPCFPLNGSNDLKGRKKTITTRGSKRSLSTVSDGKRNIHKTTHNSKKKKKSNIII